MMPTMSLSYQYHTTIPYADYQMRIAYATYEMIQKMPGGDRHKAFTRILHRTPRDPDPLADEIQTFRADPLQPECDDWCEYPVSDRANAVKQFWEYAKKNKMLNEDWYYMIESDYVFMKPLEIPKTPKNDEAYGYFFHYINPTAHPHEMAVLYPWGDATSVAHSGPAPVLMSLDNWIKVTEDWETMAALIESKADITERLGWVREMYGFSIAMAKNGIKFITEQGAENRFISEPPGMDTLGNSHAFHYTLATIFKTLDDKDVWGYDKRFHVDPSEVINVPKITPLPPFKEGEWKFIEGNPVTREKYDCINMMIARMNDAIDTLKPLHTKG